MVYRNSFENLWVRIDYLDNNKVTGLYRSLWTCWLCDCLLQLLLLLLSGTIKVFVYINIGWHDNFDIGIISTEILTWRSFTLLEKKKKKKRKQTFLSNENRMNCVRMFRTAPTAKQNALAVRIFKDDATPTAAEQKKKIHQFIGFIHLFISKWT